METTEMHELTEKAEALEEALEALATAREALEAAGLAQDPAFRAYHLAELEGAEHGWLGGPFLVDAIAEALAEINEEIEEAR